MGEGRVPARLRGGVWEDACVVDRYDTATPSRSGGVVRPAICPRIRILSCVLDVICIDAILLIPR